jgi:hypothetical protein
VPLPLVEIHGPTPVAYSEFASVANALESCADAGSIGAVAGSAWFQTLSDANIPTSLMLDIGLSAGIEAASEKFAGRPLLAVRALGPLCFLIRERLTAWVCRLEA